MHARRRPGQSWEVLPGPPCWGDLERHVRGELELGLYPVTTSPACLVLQVPDPPSGEAVARAGRQRRLPLAAGSDGLSLWLPFTGPVPARTVTDLAELLGAAAGLGLKPPDPNRPQSLPPADRSPQAWQDLAALRPVESWRAARLVAERLDREFGPLPTGAAPTHLGPEPEHEVLEATLGACLDLRGPLPPGLGTLLEHTRMSQTPRGWARCWNWMPDGLACAPGLWPDLQHALEQLGHPYRLVDRRLQGPIRQVPVRPVLRQEESHLVSGLLEMDRCRLHSLTSDVPRLLARAALASRALPALVVTDGVEAWRAEVSRDLGVPEKEIGILDGQQAWLGNLVTVGSWRSLLNRNLAELSRYVAHLVLDPGDDLSGPALIGLVRQFAARYALTLEPSQWRPAPAMLRAWLGERLDVGPRDFRPARPRHPAETPPASRPGQGSRRRPDSSEQLLLSLG